MKISPATSGFLKAFVLALVFAAATYLENAANLTGVVNPTIALVIAAIASGIESNMKAKSNGTAGLFGAVRIK